MCVGKEVGAERADGDGLRRMGGGGGGRRRKKEEGRRKEQVGGEDSLGEDSLFRHVDLTTENSLTEIKSVATQKQGQGRTGTGHTDHEGKESPPPEGNNLSYILTIHPSIRTEA